MEDLGYDSHNSMLNLGSLAIFSFFYFIKLFVYSAILKPANYFTGRFANRIYEMKQTLFYRDIIFLVIEAYLEFLIAGYLNLSEPLTTKNGEVVSIFIGWYCVLSTLVVFPMLFAYLLLQPHETLQSFTFRKKWGGLYDRVDSREKFSLMYYPIFCLRRVVFCFLCFYVFSLPSIQYIALMLHNVFILEFIAGQKPLQGRFLNRLEISNEMCSLICAFHMAFFTDWIPDETT